MAGVAHFLRDSQAASVVVAVKALLTDQMVAAEPDKEWPGYTHVRTLGDRPSRTRARRHRGTGRDWISPLGNTPPHDLDPVARIRQ